MSKKQNVNTVQNKVETPKTRTVQEVQAEYQSVCLQLGDAVHRFEEAPHKIERMKKRLMDLDLEGELAYKVFETEQKRLAEETAAKVQLDLKKPANPKGD